MGRRFQIEEGPALTFKAGTKKQPAGRRKIPACRNCAPSSAFRRIADDTHYDARVAEAVRKFQESAELKATGVLDDLGDPGVVMGIVGILRNAELGAQCGTRESSGAPAGCFLVPALNVSAGPSSI